MIPEGDIKTYVDSELQEIRRVQVDSGAIDHRSVAMERLVWRLAGHLQNAVDAAHRVLQDLHPGREDKSSFNNWHFWADALRKYQAYYNWFFGQFPAPEEFMVPKDNCPVDPWEVKATGWTDWQTYDRASYRGRYEVRIYHVPDGSYAVWVGHVYLDYYDEWDDARDAAMAYCENDWESRHGNG